MCQTTVNLTSKALDKVTDAEVLLKIKGVIALFIQTMERWGYSVSMLDNFLLTLFGKYAELLKRRFSEDFQEIVSTDDYMPMAIQTMDEYEKVVNVSWFKPEKPLEELGFPCVLPFSQMYPLCCIDIRNFLNQFYFFSDDHFQRPNVIAETLRKVRKAALCGCMALNCLLNMPNRRSMNSSWRRSVIRWWKDSALSTSVKSCRFS